jgi:hypothetical protein
MKGTNDEHHNHHTVGFNRSGCCFIVAGGSGYTVEEAQGQTAGNKKAAAVQRAILSSLREENMIYWFWRIYYRIRWAIEEKLESRDE